MRAGLAGGDKSFLDVRRMGRSLPRRLVLRAWPEGRLAGLCGHGFSCDGGMPDRRG